MGSNFSDQKDAPSSSLITAKVFSLPTLGVQMEALQSLQGTQRVHY